MFTVRQRSVASGSRPLCYLEEKNSLRPTLQGPALLDDVESKGFPSWLLRVPSLCVSPWKMSSPVLSSTRRKATLPRIDAPCGGPFQASIPLGSLASVSSGSPFQAPFWSTCLELHGHGPCGCWGHQASEGGRVKAQGECRLPRQESFLVLCGCVSLDVVMDQMLSQKDQSTSQTFRYASAWVHVSTNHFFPQAQLTGLYGPAPPLSPFWLPLRRCLPSSGVRSLLLPGQQAGLYFPVY